MALLQRRSWPILERLGQVRHVNGIGAGEVGDGTCQAQGLRDGGGGEVELAGRGPQQAVAGSLNGGRASLFGDARGLALAGGDHPRTDSRRWLAEPHVRQLRGVRWRHLDVDGDPVAQRIRDTPLIPAHLGGRAGAGALHVAEPAAGAGGGRGHQLKRRRQHNWAISAFERDAAVVKNLAEALQMRAEGGQVGEQQHAAVG